MLGLSGIIILDQIFYEMHNKKLEFRMNDLVSIIIPYFKKKKIH